MSSGLSPMLQRCVRPADAATSSNRGPSRAGAGDGSTGPARTALVAVATARAPTTQTPALSSRAEAVTGGTPAPRLFLPVEAGQEHRPDPAEIGSQGQRLHVGDERPRDGA